MAGFGVVTAEQAQVGDGDRPSQRPIPVEAAFHPHLLQVTRHRADLLPHDAGNRIVQGLVEITPFFRRLLPDPATHQGIPAFLWPPLALLTPIGTMAHEYLQARQAFVNVSQSQKEALEVWNQVYRGRLGVALTDCITTDAFLKDCDYLFSGVRHVSGDPCVWGEKFIRHYQDFGIDPKTKTLVFSDSLDFDRALDIADHFQGRIQTSFGIGTFLTNDLGDFTRPDGEVYRPLNIVMKMVECDSMPVAKISDEPGKSMCNDPVYLANLKARFNVK